MNPMPHAAQPIRELVTELPAVFHGTLFGVAVWQYLALLLVGLLAMVARKIIAYVVQVRLSAVGCTPSPRSSALERARSAARC